MSDPAFYVAILALWALLIIATGGEGLVSLLAHIGRYRAYRRRNRLTHWADVWRHTR